MNEVDEIKEYLHYWKCKFSSEPELLKEDAIAKVYIVRGDEEPGWYVIVGYGPIAHFKIHWANELGPEDLVLSYFLGNLMRVEARVKKEMKEDSAVDKDLQSRKRTQFQGGNA